MIYRNESVGNVRIDDLYCMSYDATRYPGFEMFGSFWTLEMCLSTLAWPLILLAGPLTTVTASLDLPRCVEVMITEIVIIKYYSI